jgi:hypothetical protein
VAAAAAVVVVVMAVVAQRIQIRCRQHKVSSSVPCGICG